MNLNELTGQLLRSEAVRGNVPGFGVVSERPGLDVTSSFGRLIQVVQNEGRTRAVLSSAFWQVVSLSDFFNRFLKALGRGDPVCEGGRMILTMHDDGSNNRYDLLMLLPNFPPEQSQSFPLAPLLREFDTKYSDFAEATSHWFEYRFQELKSLRESDSLTGDDFAGQAVLLDALSPGKDGLVAELLQNQDFSIMVAPMPETILTNKFGSPAWGVSLSQTSPVISTAGVATTDRQGTSGVTACLHGVVEDPKDLVKMFNAHGASFVIGKQVFVDGHPGVVRTADLITDSCFIEMDPSVLTTAMVTNGPLTNKSPSRSEAVRFDGFSSKQQKTFVTEVDLPIPFVSAGEQAKIYTQPVTNPGDSGSALVNDFDYVLGFSHRRTGLGQPIEFSEWIWAQSVYIALGL